MHWSNAAYTVASFVLKWTTLRKVFQSIQVPRKFGAWTLKSKRSFIVAGNPCDVVVSSQVIPTLKTTARAAFTFARNGLSSGCSGEIWNRHGNPVYLSTA